MREITVCIATHRRPDGLRTLLKSLGQQVEAPPFDVVVVDNDPAQSAKPIITEFADLLPITYLVEPVRGLARVRNRAVQATSANFVAFIDDDEWAIPSWLASLHRLAISFSADAIIGPVRIVFGPGVQPHVKSCQLFREPAVADGDVVPWYATRTGNALVRRSSFPDVVAPFATRLDLTGGEDVDLFCRMIDAGANIRASSDAVVFEARPASRANVRWILRRSLRNGATIADVEWKKLSTGSRLRRGRKAALKALTTAFRAGVHWRRDRAYGLQQLIGAAENVGKVAYLLGIRIEEYRVHS